MSEHCELYRAFDANSRLLYVGISVSGHNRFTQHRGNSPWWSQCVMLTIERYPTRRAALQAELVAIQKEHPIHNKAGVDLSVERPEPARLPLRPAHDAATPERIMKTAEAAAYLSLSVSLLNKLRLTGGGPRFLKFHRSVRYRESDLRDYVKERIASSTSTYG